MCCSRTNISNSFRRAPARRRTTRARRRMCPARQHSSNTVSPHGITQCCTEHDLDWYGPTPRDDPGGRAIGPILFVVCIICIVCLLYCRFFICFVLFVLLCLFYCFVLFLVFLWFCVCFIVFCFIVFLVFCIILFYNYLNFFFKKEVIKNNVF